MKITETHNTSHLFSALKTFNIEIDGLVRLKEALAETDLGRAFEKTVDLFASVRGQIIITGIGKSGHVARKIAATLRSTGSSALYLHPGEASHGDLGAISQNDVVFAITWSGVTSELGDIINYCGMYKLPLVVATSRADSWAGKAADICLALPEVREACPNALAPTSSTTMQMVLGDAMAVALIKARGFTPRHFSMFHPGGNLGARLAKLNSVMGTGDVVPRIPIGASIRHATVEMSSKRYGCTAVVDGKGVLVGAFTDGDLRRCITMNDLEDRIERHMSPRPLAAAPTLPCIEALAMMNANAVSVLFVTDKEEKLIGIAHIHDLLRLSIDSVAT